MQYINYELLSQDSKIKESFHHTTCKVLYKMQTPVTFHYYTRAKFTSIVPRLVAKLSLEERSKLALESDLAFFLALNLGMVMPPVIKFEVDLESSFISDMVDRSITDLESFLRADGVKLLSNTSRAASVSNASVSTWGQIYYRVAKQNFFNNSLFVTLPLQILMTKLCTVTLPRSWRRQRRNIWSTSPWIPPRHPRYHLTTLGAPPDLDNGFSLSSQYYSDCLKILRPLGCRQLCQTLRSHEARRRYPVKARDKMVVDSTDFHYTSCEI